MIKYEIRENDIRHNVNIVLHRAGVPVWGVLKYNGYGMGLLPMAHLLKEDRGRWCVFNWLLIFDKLVILKL